MIRHLSGRIGAMTLDKLMTSIVTRFLNSKSSSEKQLEAGEHWQPHDLVFCTEIGTPVEPSNLRRTLNKLTTQAGLGTWSPNELRHSAVSILSAAGVPIEQIADQVGRETTRTAQTVYRHILKSRARPWVRDGRGLRAD